MATQEFADFEIQTDFTNIPAMSGEFSNLPIGTYKFQIKNVSQKNAKKTNNPMVVVEFEVIEAISVPGLDTDEALATLAGQKCWGNYVLVPQSMGRLKTLMVACGATLTGFRAAELLEAFIIGDVIHSLGEAAVGQDGTPTPGKIFSNIVNERSAEEAAPEPVVAPPVTKGKPAAAATAAKPVNGSRRA